MSRACLAVVVLWVLISARGQGTLQNLGFEQATLVPISGAPYARVQFAPAFPGWTGYVAGVQEVSALYNDRFLDTSGISIIDSGATNAAIGGPKIPFEGNFMA